MSPWSVLGAALLAACVVAIPPPVDPAGLPACSAGSYGVLSPIRCESERDCRACGAGGSCRAAAPTDAACEAPTCAVACCEGRCVVVSDSALGDSAFE